VSEALLEPLTGGEERVLRYLPTNLSKREIAQELYVSFHTIKTHMKHIYQKLDAHNRREAVERAREHGLLASASSSFALAS
jgi:LuxR family maltose regulon positive regulatory protein